MPYGQGILPDVKEGQPPISLIKPLKYVKYFIGLQSNAMIEDITCIS